MTHGVNHTVITLIPKVSNADRVKFFRPISCCTVLYKLVSKILTAKMKLAMDKIVHLSQFGFIPNIQLGDNVLLAFEIIKGYGRKYMSPRCMIKINMRKAYDSVE